MHHTHRRILHFYKGLGKKDGVANVRQSNKTCEIQVQPTHPQTRKGRKRNTSSLHKHTGLCTRGWVGDLSSSLLSQQLQNMHLKSNKEVVSGGRGCRSNNPLGMHADDTLATNPKPHSSYYKRKLTCWIPIFCVLAIDKVG